jgi:hypothetical protein
MLEPIRPSFEESIDIIDSEISKRRHKWHLTAISWMDFDDVAQKLRLHIYKKWDQWNHNLPLRPWLNQVINNQMTNILRNNYSNYSRPCLKCKFNLGENTCQLYSIQSSLCVDYAKWEKTKKPAYDIKFPVSMNASTYSDSGFTIENVLQNKEEIINVESYLPSFHKIMKKNLNAVEWKVYDYMFIQNLEDAEIAKKMGYKMSYKDGRLSYRQISKIKAKILKKARILVKEVI